MKTTWAVTAVWNYLEILKLKYFLLPGKFTFRKSSWVLFAVYHIETRHLD